MTTSALVFVSVGGNRIQCSTKEQEMMIKNLSIIGFIVQAMFLSGCFVVVEEETRGPSEPVPSLLDDTIVEIDAVGKLSFPSDVEQGYKRIASRQGLSAEAQVYLVEAVLRKLQFPNAREEVLLALIANPDFSRAAERVILEKIDKIAFPSSREIILKAISDRKSQP
jgi:hypothetical protein